MAEHAFPVPGELINAAPVCLRRLGPTYLLGTPIPGQPWMPQQNAPRRAVINLTKPSA